MITAYPSTRWWLALLAAGAVAFLSLYPQIELRVARGRDWQGSYAYIDTDEVAYCAYLNALLDGRPRRNDPYSGRDDSQANQQRESLFSIQFLPAYLTATLARTARVDAATAFVLLMLFGAAASTLALFWVLNQLTKDDQLSAVGSLAVLCLGTLGSAQGAVRYLLGSEAAYNYLPFLRRYIPLIPFPLFFIFCGLVWLSAVTHSRRKSLLSAAAAGLTFASLVYSYFFLWTAALAWLGCFLFAVLASRPERWKDALQRLLLVLGIATLALIPYSLLLSHRAEAMDAAQLLYSTHSPDLARAPELLGLLIIGLLLFYSRSRRLQWRSYTAAFAFACALMPCVVFNQQIVTGRTLQPIHYEQFIANYVALLAGVLTIALIKQSAPDGSRCLRSFHLAAFSVVVFSWGMIETRIATRVYAPYNLERDEGWAVSKRLRELYAEEAKQTGSSPVVLCAVDLLAEDIPTATPDAVLWARHMHVFAGVDLAENKRRFYKQLYYTDVSEDEVREGLQEKDFYYTVALFGWDRANFNLTSEPRLVTRQEIDEEVAKYRDFVKRFDRQQAVEPRLSYLVVYADEEQSFANIDKWYRRDAGERIGGFILYKLQLKE